MVITAAGKWPARGSQFPVRQRWHTAATHLDKSGIFNGWVGESAGSKGSPSPAQISQAVLPAVAQKQ